MTAINDKDGVTGLLERLERVCREVRGLPDEIKGRMALNVGCLVNDLDELEGLVEQARDCVEDDLHDGIGYYEESELSDYGYVHKSEINCRDNRASSDDQDRP